MSQKKRNAEDFLPDFTKNPIVLDTSDFLDERARRSSSSGDPFEDDDGVDTDRDANPDGDGGSSRRGSRRGKREKQSKHPILKALFFLFLAVLVVGLIYAGVRYVAVPAWNNARGQAIDQTQTGGNNTGDDQAQTDDTGADDGAAGGTSIAEMANEARLLDVWFADIPEANWVEKTCAELNGSQTMALGTFCKDRLVVLQDGTVIAQAYHSESGEKIPTIITDYEVKPAELRGHVLMFIDQDTNIACSVAQIAKEDPTVSLPTSVYLFNLTTGEYEFQKTDTINAHAAG